MNVERSFEMEAAESEPIEETELFGDIEVKKYEIA
jgi:hypothetical protein